MNWRTAWRRLQRWTAAGIWERIVEALRAMAPDAGWEAHLLDSTVIRAHAHAAGARQHAGRQALGRSRGGFSTKLHLRCDGRGRPVAFHLTGGERHDLLGVGPLFERGILRTGRRGRPRWKPEAVIADKAYSAAWLLDVLRRKRIVPIIPSRADQPENPDFDHETYRGRNAVERTVGKLKQFRRVATRYDKLAAHYLAFVHIASVMVWLRSLGDMALNRSGVLAPMQQHSLAARVIPPAERTQRASTTHRAEAPRAKPRLPEPSPMPTSAMLGTSASAIMTPVAKTLCREDVTTPPAIPARSAVATPVASTFDQ
jgi:transposase